MISLIIASYTHSKEAMLEFIIDCIFVYLLVLPVILDRQGNTKEPICSPLLQQSGVMHVSVNGGVPLYL